MGIRECIADIRASAGRDLTDDEIVQILEALEARQKMRAAERQAEGGAQQLRAAAFELGEDARAAAIIERRNAGLNFIKRHKRRDFYDQAPSVLLAIEAKLVGVNTQWRGSGASVDALGRALVKDYTVGLASDLDRAQLFETARSGRIDREIAAELFEISKLEDGAPGVTGNREALAVAEIIAKYQKNAVDGLNREGAWIGHYDGYVSRTSHDPDRIRRAGFDAWRAEILERLDTARTFDGVEDADRFLRGVYDGLVTGIHFTHDGLEGFKAPAFTGPANLAEKVSQGRVLHFKDAAAWMDYEESFGTATLMESVLRSLELSARSTALMAEFGTNPRAEFEADLRHLAETRRGDHDLVRKLHDKRRMLSNRFDEIDGTTRMPVNRMTASIGQGVRAIQNMAKLGGVLLASIGDVPLKASELRYQGVNLLQAYGDSFASIGRGRGRGQVREIADLMRAGAEGMVGDVAQRFSVTDTVPGRSAKLMNTFLRFTGLTYWTDAQRVGASLMMGRHLGTLRKSEWAALPDSTRRILDQFNIGREKWDLIRAADLTQANGRHYVTPDVGERVSEAGIIGVLRSRGQVVTPARIAAFRRELSLDLLTYFTDRAETAVVNPGARERAILRQGTEPGTPLGEALRLIAQFKSFPTAVITKAFGREIYGGQGGLGKAGGIVHLIVGATIFGYVSMTAKDLAKGRGPRDPTDPKTWAAAFVQGGGAGIYGDFLVGEYSRFGRTMSSTILGPTLGQVDNLIELWNRVKAGEDLGAQAFRFVFSNMPFTNLFYTRIALDYLVLYQIQEALNPGFLKRFEARVERENKQSFILSPSAAIPRGGGDRIFEGLR